MALGNLTLSTTAGVQGRPFQANIIGLTTGRVEVLGDGSPGFSTVNGRVMSDRLPYPVSTVVLREHEPGVGVGYHDTRIDISAAGAPVQEVAPDGTITYSGVGGAPTAKTASASASGAVYTVSRLLGSSSTLALITGTNSNLTLNATTGVISAASAIAVGASQAAIVRETNGSIAVEYPVTIAGVSAGGTPTPTPGPTLSISGTPAAASVNSSDTYTPTISGGTPPYTLSLLSGTLPPGRAVNGSARTVTGTYTTAGTYSHVLRATDSVGATADLNVNLTVSAAGMTDNIIVANRLQYPNDSQSLNSTNTARREHYASPQGAITNLRPQFMWNFLNTGGVTGSGAAASLKHTIEYPEGVFHPTMWAGVRELVTASNANYTADVVISSVTGQPLEIPAGAKFWERTVYISAASKAFPTFAYPASVSTLGVSDGKLAGDFADSGTIPADTTSAISWGMTALKGTVKATGAKAAIIYGDSLSVGQGENATASAKGSVGMMSRKIDEAYPNIVIARGGYYASQMATIIGGTAFPNFIAQLGATHAVVQMGLNDLSLGSRTAAQVMASRKTIHDTTAARITGIAAVHTTITPRVNSTSGNYSSVGDQSPKTDGNMADLTPLNALIRAEALVMDYADAAMSARDSNVFSGPFPPVADGTHMLTPKIVAVAGAVNLPF